MNVFWPGGHIADLFNIEHPVIAGGMVYNSGAKLTAAVSQAGGLGLLGAGSMRPDLLRDQIRKTRSLTDKPFGINIPLLYKYAGECLDVGLEEGVRIFFTSAGSPKKAMGKLKEADCTVVHVAASPMLARKCQDAGCDAVVVEGFEAGGHNGREELTTMVLIPQTVAAVDIPVIAAGGIASGQQIAAVMAMGAAGVQIGSRFAITQESSSHENFKQAVVEAGCGDTHLVLKRHVPVRLLKSPFYEEVVLAEARCADREELTGLLGQGRSRLGMLEGDMENGELEIGQVAGMIDDIPTVASVMDTMLAQYTEACGRLAGK